MSRWGFARWGCVKRPHGAAMGQHRALSVERGLGWGWREGCAMWGGRGELLGRLVLMGRGKKENNQASKIRFQAGAVPLINQVCLWQAARPGFKGAEIDDLF